MLAKIFSVTHLALETLTVEVEVNAGRGKPNIYIVGLPSKAVQESEQRVKTALQNCGLKFPAKKITINLAPADIIKEGPLFDLPIAIGILNAFGYIELGDNIPMFLGELSLDGRVRRVKGVLPAVLHARAHGFSHIVIPKENESEVNIISGIIIHPIQHISQLIEHYEMKAQLPCIIPQAFGHGTSQVHTTDFADIAGQQTAKRALEIAAAGAHNVLMNGSPGSGKSMLAKAVVSILPPLTEEEAIEVTTIYSVTGMTLEGLISRRPFRAPHHTISEVGLIGGSSKLKPGEISLAHRGVLFMDEFPEFTQNSLESLRQPMEDHTISITRASGSTSYPAHFTLVAAANPCPCGYLLSKKKECQCQPHSIEHYKRKLSGPILDRIDLHVNVQEVESTTLFTHQSKNLEHSEAILERVLLAREIQRQRFKNSSFLTNGELDSKAVKQFCVLTPEARALLEHAMIKLKLSARSFFKLIKIAQTIADLEAAPNIQKQHLSEAIQYRPNAF
ncbi:MAG: YifB family Mg chelatase-like AAA ATPase [Patescibacteria group bacterium]